MDIGYHRYPKEFGRPCAMPGGAPKSIFRNTVCRLFSPEWAVNLQVSRCKASDEFLFFYRQLLYIDAIRPRRALASSRSGLFTPGPILNSVRRLHPRCCLCALLLRLSLHTLASPQLPVIIQAQSRGPVRSGPSPCMRFKKCHGEITSVHAERA